VRRPSLLSRVTVVEVGPRDGLQNEQVTLPIATRIAFVEALADAGLPVIEIGAFVNPARVPQMAGTADVARGLTRRAGVRYSALVPNLRGLATARGAGLDELAIFAAASETFSQRNINQSVEASLDGYGAVVREARTHGIRVRGYLSTAFGCPFEGDVPVARVVALTERLLAMGVFEVAVSDTIGVATPGQVVTMVESLSARVPLNAIALHMHDTRGTALANVYAALEAGVATFDASAGGLGGCPFAPGAAGNLATEDLLYMLHGLGIETGVDLDGVVQAARLVAGALDHRLPSRYFQAVTPR
jgi:isopropylmalate/homocitrate/citramalate synthase